MELCWHCWTVILEYGLGRFRTLWGRRRLSTPNGKPPPQAKHIWPNLTGPFAYNPSQGSGAWQAALQLLPSSPSGDSSLKVLRACARSWAAQRHVFVLALASGFLLFCAIKYSSICPSRTEQPRFRQVERVPLLEIHWRKAFQKNFKAMARSVVLSWFVGLKA